MVGDVSSRPGTPATVICTDSVFDSIVPDAGVPDSSIAAAAASPYPPAPPSAAPAATPRRPTPPASVMAGSRASTPRGVAHNAIRASPQDKLQHMRQRGSRQGSRQGDPRRSSKKVTESSMGLVMTGVGEVYAVAYPVDSRSHLDKTKCLEATSSYRQDYGRHGNFHAKHLEPYKPHAPRNRLPDTTQRRAHRFRTLRHLFCESPIPAARDHHPNPYASVARLSYSKKILSRSGLMAQYYRDSVL